MLPMSASQQVTIGLAQIAPRLGDVAANLTCHLDYIDRARSQGVDLLIFPELSLTGYQVKDLVSDVACRPTPDDPIFGPLLAASRDLDLVVGFVEVDERWRFPNSAAYLSGGRVVHVHRKVYLPTYTLFDEGRYFAPGDTFRAFDTRLGRVGILICEDFWHMAPPYILWADGADILLLLSASPGRGLSRPGRLDSTRFVELMNQAYASALTDFVLHCNRVGYEDGINFWGGSHCFGPDGEMIAQAPYFEEALVTARLDLTELRRVRTRLPLLRDERPELTLRELQRIMQRKIQPN
jgi:NAD+ synthase (glutamine-hydrolysing)